MKKILLTLLALVGTMSMNAQVMKPGMEIMKNGVVVATYTADQADEVVFKEVAIPITGTAKRTGDIDVNWVQLWDKGPKFAEYNVGATSASEYGGYYNWGKTTNKDTSGDYKSGTDALTGDDDTATKLWGDNWRMPTKEELSNAEGGLLYECKCTWTTQNGVNGLLCTGKGAYSSNSVFLPAAGECIGGVFKDRGHNGYYWSSTPNGSDGAYNLDFDSGYQLVYAYNRDYGYSVRAVLAEE